MSAKRLQVLLVEDNPADADFVKMHQTWCKSLQQQLAL
jgi:hypothetical protein